MKLPGKHRMLLKSQGRQLTIKLRSTLEYALSNFKLRRRGFFYCNWARINNEARVQINADIGLSFVNRIVFRLFHIDHNKCIEVINKMCSHIVGFMIYVIE